MPFLAEQAFEDDKQPVRESGILVPWKIGSGQHRELFAATARHFHTRRSDAAPVRVLRDLPLLGRQEVVLADASAMRAHGLIAPTQCPPSSR